LLTDDSLKCPRCKFEFLIEGPEGQCPSCGNTYSRVYIFEKSTDIVKTATFDWEDYGDETRQSQKSFKISKNDRPSVCPKCAINFEELITWSDKFCVIRKKCLRCGITDSEIIRKEKNSV
jgi:hypothetical protein